MCIQLQKSIIYGPVQSRRLGKSLGINILPTFTKLCSFNCIYCQYGLTTNNTESKTVRAIFPTIEEFEKELTLVLKERPAVDRITFSGNGEPTLHPEFEYIAEMTFKLRNLYLPNTSIALFTNGSLFSRGKIRRALAFVDEPFLKIDAGSEKLFKQINRPAESISLKRIIHISREIPNLSVQSMFLDGFISNISENSLEEYFRTIRAVNPVKVHIYSIDRPTPAKGLQVVPEEILRQIAEEGQQRTGIPFQYFV